MLSNVRVAHFVVGEITMDALKAYRRRPKEKKEPIPPRLVNTGPVFDNVVEGEAVNVTDQATLQRLADEYLSKYGEGWRFAVRDGVFVGAGGEAIVYEVRPQRVFGFGKGQPFSQTRWRF